MRLREELAKANQTAAEFERLYKSTVTFQGRAHEKKVQAKRDRDAVITQKVQLEKRVAELTAENARLERMQELYA